MKASSGSGEWPRVKVLSLWLLICLSHRLFRLHKYLPWIMQKQKRGGDASHSKHFVRNLRTRLLSLRTFWSGRVTSYFPKEKQPPREFARRLNVSRKHRLL